MTGSFKRILSFMAVAAITLGIMTGCVPTSQPGESSPSSVKNDLLLEASSPFEDLTEFAEAGDTDEMDQTIADIQEHVEKISEVLDSSEREELASILADIGEAREAGEHQTVALLSVEGYRAVISALEDEALVVPKAVSLLDYSGFKLHAIANVDAPDWLLIEEVVQEAQGLWGSIEGRVDEKGLRDAMNTAIDGMQEAVEIRDARLAVFAAQVDLDLVDLLENYFEAQNAAH